MDVVDTSRLEILQVAIKMLFPIITDMNLQTM